MKYRDEYRDPASARRLSAEIARTATRPWTLMEVCGGQTHAILRHGIDRMLPEGVELIHGPGCPVCVTPLGCIDKAIEIAMEPGVIFCSFGDMLRVPGSSGDLAAARSRGADVRIVYSPLDAVALAEANPQREVVFLAVGFETTAPANAMAVRQAHRSGLGNFSLLVAQVLVPPAIESLLTSPGCRVQGFLAAGHVCTVMGLDAYEQLAQTYRVPIVVTGFEPVDILDGVLACVSELEQGSARVLNRYARVVRSEGNPAARAMVEGVFAVVPRYWRGMGLLPASGLGLAPAWQQYDAERRFGGVEAGPEPAGECISGLVLRGERRPDQCPAFGSRCTPEAPLGVTMVSGEGACAAYFRYREPQRAFG
ncbi:MAG: hydrogenase formation protein HypD [Chromatiales bacterium]|nr:hydrogenase formation protein HypD [Chromatiales bacterium]